MVRVFSRVNGSTYRPRLTGSGRSTWVNASQPRRSPTTEYPSSALRYTTDLITELRPGTSPPPVRIPIRFAAMLTPRCRSIVTHLHGSNPMQAVARPLLVDAGRRNEE